MIAAKPTPEDIAGYVANIVAVFNSATPDQNGRGRNWYPVAHDLAIMVGDGGKYVEVYNDVQLLMPPVTTDEARAAIRRLRIAPFFSGVRGEAPLDLDALCAAILALGEVITACADEIASIDLNPVLVGSVGQGVVIVDALVERNLVNQVTT